MDANTKLTNDFRFGEFYCLGVQPPKQYWDNIKELAEELQKIRYAINKPMTITSGYRTPQHNANVGGASRSQHLFGKAADFKVYGVTGKELAVYASRFSNLNGIGIGGLFCHGDTRDIFAVWTY